MTNKTLSSGSRNEIYLEDPKRLEKVQPIMERLGIEADKFLGRCLHEELKDNMISRWLLYDKAFYLQYGQVEGTCWEFFKTYRADKLEMALPETLAVITYVADYEVAKILGKNLFSEYYTLINKVQNLIIEYRSSIGQKKSKALADLLILLEENNLLGERT